VSYGYGGSGFFCTITCGHTYAVRAVRELKRLEQLGIVALGSPKVCCGLARDEETGRCAHRSFHAVAVRL
jgi:hypothetical protein